MSKISYTVAAVALSGIAGGALGLAATAGAAPSGNDSPRDIISQLEGDGYEVIVKNLSDRPLDQTSVESVMPADSVTTWVWSANRNHRYPKTTYRTVFVTVR